MRRGAGPISCRCWAPPARLGGSLRHWAGTAQPPCPACSAVPELRGRAAGQRAFVQAPPGSPWPKREGPGRPWRAETQAAGPAPLRLGRCFLPAALVMAGRPPPQPFCGALRGCSPRGERSPEGGSARSRRKFRRNGRPGGPRRRGGRPDSPGRKSRDQKAGGAAGGFCGSAQPPRPGQVWPVRCTEPRSRWSRPLVSSSPEVWMVG